MLRLNRMKYGFIIATTTIIIICSLFSIVEGKDTNEQVILIVINTLSFSDESLYSNIVGFKNLENYAAKGAMNIRSGSTTNASNSYLSIGGGSKGIGIKGEMGQSFLLEEIVNNKMTAREIYKWQIGEEIYTEDAIVFLPIEKIKTVVQKYSFEVGRLGDILSDNGETCKVYGNNDTDSKNRLVPLITINQKGITSGDVGINSLIADSTRPYGIKTDYSYLIDKWEESVEKEISLIVFDLGDLYRLNQYKKYMDSKYAENVKEEVMFEMGEFINYIYQNIRDNQTLIVLSPMVSNEAKSNKELLAPIWMYNEDKKGNLLTSTTTRREGIVANIDIAPTIINILVNSGKHHKMDGHVLQEINSNIDFPHLLNKTFNVYKIRTKVLSNYIFYQITVLAVATIFLFKRKNIKYTWLKTVLLSTLFMPALMLLTANYTLTNPYFYLSLVIIMSIFLAILCKNNNPITALLIVSLITFLGITIDIIFGGQMQKTSVLGYDPIIGARYYGIGNEFMGVYIGATVLLISALLDYKRTKITLVLSLIISFSLVFVLAYPTLGTNAGGVLASIATIIFFFIKELKLPWRKKIIILFSIFILAIAIFIFTNVSVSGENRSHIGNGLNQISEGNYESIFLTINRKISMNLKLIHTSSWSKIIFMAIISFLAIALRPKTKINKKLKVKYPNLLTGFLSIFVGAITALLVNDSGIVASSTMIVFLIVPMLYLIFHEKSEFKN